MGCADSIAKMLADAHFSCYFSSISPSAMVCAEPIVVLDGEFSRESRQAEEERGNVVVTVLVVREVSADAEAVAIACEQLIRHCQWELASEAWPWRVVGIDTSAPAFKERDPSGRFVWAFTATVTVARAI